MLSFSSGLFHRLSPNLDPAYDTPKKETMPAEAMCGERIGTRSLSVNSKLGLERLISNRSMILTRCRSSCDQLVVS